MPNPYLTLNIPENAGDEDIRKAYLKLIRQYPPESGGGAFQEISAAYESIKDEESRARLRLFGDLYDHRPLGDMAPSFRGARSPAGIHQWLAAIENFDGDKRS